MSNTKKLLDQALYWIGRDNEELEKILNQGNPCHDDKGQFCSNVDKAVEEDRQSEKRSASPNHFKSLEDIDISSPDITKEIANKMLDLAAQKHGELINRNAPEDEIKAALNLKRAWRNKYNSLK